MNLSLGRETATIHVELSGSKTMMPARTGIVANQRRNALCMDTEWVPAAQGWEDLMGTEWVPAAREWEDLLDTEWAPAAREWGENPGDRRHRPEEADADVA